MRNSCFPLFFPLLFSCNMGGKYQLFTIKKGISLALLERKNKSFYIFALVCLGKFTKFFALPEKKLPPKTPQDHFFQLKPGLSAYAGTFMLYIYIHRIEERKLPPLYSPRQNSQICQIYKICQICQIVNRQTRGGCQIARAPY